MKKLLSILILCLGCMGILGAQNVWKLINSNTPLLGAASNGDLFAMAGYSGLLRSQDEGETWEQVNGNYMHQCIAFSPQGRIFVFPTNYMYLQYSDDGGDTWHETTMMSSCATYDVAGLYAPSNDIVVVWSSGGEIYWTTDGGETWGYSSLASWTEDPWVNDLIANEAGDVYIGLSSGGDYAGGIFHSTLNDGLANWTSVAFWGISVSHMEFDPDGNVVACRSADGSIGFQHTPGFYLFDGTSLAIGDGGVVYTPHFMGLQAVLSYSTDHGEHFTEIGEHVPLVDVDPIGEPRLFRGADNHLYFDGGGEYWKSVSDADHILNYDYFPLINEANNRQKWNVVYISSVNWPNDYHTEIQSIRDNITLDGVDYKLVWTESVYDSKKIAGAVREENRRVYFRRYWQQSYQDEVLLYDFNLTVGDTVNVNWIGQKLGVLEESEVQVNGNMRRMLGLAEYYEDGTMGEVEEYWIEGIGSTYGFLNSGYEAMVGAYIQLLCYHKNGNLIWDNEEFDDCVMNSDGAPATFAPQGAEWYFHVWSQGPITQPPFYYLKSMVTGVEEVQGHTCSVIDGYELVYEEDGVVYWYNPSDDVFTVLYDFNAEVGDSWYCEVADYYPCQITVDSVGSVTWNGHTYRTQYVTGYIEDWPMPIMDGRIIEGIGYEKGLFPTVIIDGPEYEYMRCYLVDDEMLYHEGDYDCDYVPQTGSSCWDGSVANAYEDGDGTETNPFQIATPQQLALLAQQTNNGTGGDAHYILTDDICLNMENDSIDWPVIGKETSQNLPIDFTGVFDGNGHTIERMIIRENHIDAGLFGHTRGAVIKNLRVVDAAIQVGSDVGIIVGQAYNTSIINCTVQNSTISHEHNSNNYVGGIVGGFYPTDNASDTVYIKDCVSEVNFMDPERFFNAGGIVGRCMTMSTDGGFAVIENCENRSDVGGYHYAGGIMGSADNSHNGESLALIVKGCRNYGNISSTSFCSGGIVGYNWGVQMIGCLNMGEVVAGGGNSNVVVGGMAGLLKESIMVECANKGNVRSESASGSEIGGLVGFNDESVIANSYNLGAVSAPYDVPTNAIEAIGGIVGNSTGRIFNVYNAGALTVPETPSGSETEGYGNILGLGDVSEHYLNCYCLEQNGLPYICGNIDLLGSSFFTMGATYTEWRLTEPQYGTFDLLEALNFGAAIVLDSVPEYPYQTTWMPDTEYTNQGLPVIGSQPTPGDSFQAGDLLYTIISTDPPCVRLDGHIDSMNAAGELNIPESVMYNGNVYAVTKIGDEAFYRCIYLTGDLVIPNTVTHIGKDAFFYCQGLTGSLTLSNALTYIDNGAFHVCGFTGPLNIPNSVTYIGENAFGSDNHFTGSLIIPPSVTYIGVSAFADCIGFTGILTIPNSVTFIGQSAFSNCLNLTGSLDIPNSVTHIGDHAFYNCSGFTGTLTIPNSITTIETDAFVYCSGFTGQLVIPESVTWIGASAFEGCSGFSGSLVIPNSVTTIENHAFYECTGFNDTLVIGNSVTEIGYNAFDGCTNFRAARSLATTPPTLFVEAFDNFGSSMLIVPCGCVSAYEASWWSNFFDTIAEDCVIGLIEFHGSEWYYEIQNENGSITYQHLEYAADTTVNNKDVQIIIRTNTLYDKSGHNEVTHEYVYEEDSVVYWWNKDLQEFTVLYNLDAQPGDSWVIKVGTENITMQVNAVDLYYYDGRLFRTLHVSDDGNLFSGIIVCGIGHLSSFFPERLMTRGKGYRVEGMRCYWRDDELFFKYGNEDCDAVYKNYHFGLDESAENQFNIYPNPTHNVLVVETCHGASLQAKTYRITNLTGQILQTGSITAENQQIDVSNLPEGMYFITIGDMTRKFVVNR